MMDCKPALFPFLKGLKLSNFEGDLLEDPEFYRRLIGKLLYLNMTRPDISYVVQQLSQFLAAPRAPHFTAALNVLRYLKGTINQGLFYSANFALQLSSGLLQLKHVSYVLQLADIMTKPLGLDQHRTLASKIGLVHDISSQEWSGTGVSSPRHS
uniref:Mitochondrial protein n=1 Tax=Chenopodium quinoa TaxID=63459 RepID=A0A803LR47_CHEQI